MQELNHSIYQLVVNNQKTARELATAINKPYSTLMREVNPYDKRAKIGVETFFQLMLKSNDITPLKYMIEQLGFSLSPLESKDTV